MKYKVILAILFLWIATPGFSYNKEHMEIFDQGIYTWNKWRTQNPNIKPDLSDADFYKSNLAGYNLKNVDLNWTNLYCTNLKGADLENANLSDAYLREADLTNTNLRNADLTAAIMRKATLINTCLEGAKLIDVDLREAKLIKTDLENADMTGANLRHAKFEKANINNSRLESTIINGTQFINTETHINDEGKKVKSNYIFTFARAGFGTILPTTINHVKHHIAFLPDRIRAIPAVRRIKISVPYSSTFDLPYTEYKNGGSVLYNKSKDSDEFADMDW